MFNFVCWKTYSMLDKIDLMLPIAKGIFQRLPKIVSVDVFVVMHECWNCKQPSPAVTSVRCKDFGEGFPVYDNEANLEYARELLLLADDSLAHMIKRRYSRTTNDTYLSNGCVYCDALFGRYPLSEDIADLAVCGDGERRFSSIKRPMAEWLVMASCNSAFLFPYGYQSA